MSANIKQLKIIEFGNPILRKKTKQLSVEEITSEKVQRLIADMKYSVTHGEYGVGLAAPQVGMSLALSVITIRPTPSHPGRDVFESVIINPEIVKYVGQPVPLWEGCMSFGSNENPVFAQAMRHKKIQVKYYDEHAKLHQETLEGFVAHVFQHETDHLSGVLFVDRVEDSTTWMNAAEYLNMKETNSSKN